MTDYFVHSHALCETRAVGRGTRIWAFAHILPGASIGADCNICDGVFIENDVVVGNRVTVKCGVQLWDGVVLEDDVYVGPNATFTNDPFPRSRIRPAAFTKTIVCRGASIGANATILPGIEIGVGAMVGAGAVVTRSVPANAIVIGNPAGIYGYVDADKGESSPASVVISPPDRLGRLDTGVGGAGLYRMRTILDMRGNLSVGEFGSELPFSPKRYFMVFDVPSREIRGEHAHRKCDQFLICIRGSCRVLLDDGSKRCEYLLDRIDVGIHIPPMTWSTQYRVLA